MTILDDLQGWRTAAPGFARRQRKHLAQIRYGWDHPRRVGFVFGCQRSGTKMVMWVLDNSPVTHIYHENHASAFRDFQLRPDPLLRALIRTSPAPAQIFKPICDSHEADRILERFPDARGVWIYRDADDVANSAVHKWGGHQRDIIDAIARGDLASWGWRTARIPPELLQDLRRVHRPDLTEGEGALLFWYLRNAFFFALGLDRHPRMRLVQYEPLVQDPEENFPPLFRHLSVPFERRFVEAVRGSSVGRRDPPVASPEIRALCDALTEQLRAWQPPPARAPARLTVPSPSAGAEAEAEAVELARLSPVLVVIDTLSTGGAERYAVTVSNWLVEHGVAVILAAAPGEQNAALRPEVQFVPMPLDRVRVGLPRAAARLQVLLREHNPTAIVANSLATAWIARAAQLPWQPPIPVVAVAHGWPAHRYRLVGPLMRAADTVVAVSPEVQAHLVAGGLPPDRCEVIHNGVDCGPLGPRPEPLRARLRAEMGAQAEGDVLVIVVGRLSAQKAHHHVVAISQELQDSHPRLRLAIIGEGEGEAELRQQIEAAGQQDRIRLMGLRADVPDLLGAADVYLSTSDWEGMSLATIEAMASGLPVVATRTEGADQLLTEACGIVVPVGDAPALADAVRRLADDAALRRRLGQAARERALARFSHERMVRQLAALLTRLTDRPGSGPPR